MSDEIILVNHRDKTLGYGEKDSCHRTPAKLHRAFSIFIVNRSGQMLIQKRAAVKKTWPGFWSNACCSHPRKNESLKEAVHRRMAEELGFTCPLDHIFSFHYEATYNSEFGENEIDHVFVGQFDGEVLPNHDEIEAWEFVAIDDLLRSVRNDPQQYTPWFRKAIGRVVKYVRQNPPQSPAIDHGDTAVTGSTGS